MGLDPLSPTEIFRDRRVFLLGCTGFLGKVTLSMLLYRFPAIGRVYVMVRAGSGTASQDRFEADVVGSPVFDPLRERYGDALGDFLAQKIRVVGGDITRENLGYREEDAAAIAADIDLIINSSGKVTFNPALDHSLQTNVHGTQNIITFARRMKRPALVHVSTCFVAGNRSGNIWENEEVAGAFPFRTVPQSGFAGAHFSVRREIAECDKLAARVRDEADDSVEAAHFLKAARERLRSENRDPDNPRYLRLAQARERKNWIRRELTKRGIERARRWGWPNIYCYAKSLAEQIVVEADDIVRAIVRPSIVESACRFPFAGWNEGFTTTAPLVFLALKGQSRFVASDHLILDLVPVDSIAGGLLSVAAQALVEAPQLVYHLASGDTNPSTMREIITRLGLHKRQYFQGKEEGSRLLNEVFARMETRLTSERSFDRVSVPMMNQVAQRASKWLGDIRPRWGADRVAAVVDRAKDNVDRFEVRSAGVAEAFETYRPFTAQNHYVFRTDNIRALRARIPLDEHPFLPYEVADIDWKHYWLDIHLPGLHRWVLPELEKDFGITAPTTPHYTYNHLVELLETSAKLHHSRIAMRIQRDGREDRYSYAELHELVLRVAAFLKSRGVGQGQRVLLISENRPEWGMAYFGIVKAGATCVPLDKDLAENEIIRLARAGEVAGVVLSETLAELHPGVIEKLGAVSIPAWLFAEAFALDDDPALDSAASKAALPKVNSDRCASLIFTSGTTGRPKGVMLSHRNFTYMVSELATVFDVGPRDGLLSVLPLHHTLEFSAGLLLPLARGAAITYLEEISAANMSKALAQARITAIVGVPALWELFARKMRSGLRKRARWLERAVVTLSDSNSWLVQRSGIDLGPLLFFPLHRRLGGQIRYLISGGSALSPAVKRFFHGIGVPLLEGYGLTEAAPVLAVARPSDRFTPAAVGRPLPHVEIKISEPNAQGVGEIVARGPTIMSGYFNDENASAQALRDGWLHTGDLGYQDQNNNLVLAGRSKDLIVGSSGENVYPDDLEALYGVSKLIKELSIVGLKIEHDERPAALVVPSADENGLEAVAVEAQIREHFRRISASLPGHKRVAVVHFSTEDLPRTATRKVKRDEVLRRIGILQVRLEEGRLRQGPKHASRSGLRLPADTRLRIFELVAGVCGRSAESITDETLFDALGFDSLMYAELTSALEGAGLHVRDASADLPQLTRVSELVALLQSARRSEDKGPASRRLSPVPSAGLPDEHSAPTPGADLKIPEGLAALGTQTLTSGQRFIYQHVFRTSIRGQTHIPPHTNFIAVANHASHLDTGLVKFALGPFGEGLRVLAASDYFFNTPLKRAYFQNFTHVVPMDRSGSLRRSLELAVSLLEEGKSILIFPEGTRSPDGMMGSFKASLGYLALHARAGILPIYLRGTFEALPKGSGVIKQRDISAEIGPLLDAEALAHTSKGLRRTQAYRLVASLAEEAVRNLANFKGERIDVAAFRALGQGGQQGRAHRSQATAESKEVD